MASPGRRPAVVAGVAAAVLLLDTTVVYVGLPSIGEDVGAGEGLPWVVDAYAVALAGTLLAAGALADRFGRRRVLLVGLAIFLLASLACGLAGSLEVLAVARAAQGVGGAAMFSGSLAVLAAAYEGEERARALALWGAIGGVALAIGPALGGLVADGPGWRWLFLVNVPVIAVTALACRGLPESRDPDARGVPWLGAVLAGASLATGVTVVLRGEAEGWGSARTLGGAALAALLLAALTLHERRGSRPLLPPGTLGRPAFLAAAAFAVLQSVAIYPVFYLLALELQGVDGRSPLEAGLVVLPITLALLVAVGPAGRLVARVPLERLLVAGLLLVAAGLLALRLPGADDGAAALLPGMLLLGAGSGILSPAFAATMLAVLPPERAGVAAATANTLRQAGIAVGIAAVGAVLTAQLAQDPALTATLAGRTGAALPDGPAAAFDGALDDALLLCAAAAVLGALAAARVGALRSPAPGGAVSVAPPPPGGGDPALSEARRSAARRR